ncbi:MAG TPA: nucleoside 2-deoxyribosyltransferase [Methanoregulaceae archaeon]|nr:nucleoside 2-deoxyribosyltransferase [Methanoregulaceae archaeon]HRY75754.1 nucleoside 2-deoxyribosyltransferase [Methanoregulaceae archaeon]
MYVLVSPCVLNPSLRAEGITRPSDIAAFNRAKERCRRFGIEMVPLPCPETIYLGAGRSPGTYLERLNTPAFLRLIEELESQVRIEIAERGPPLCIVGVNSSPTCGVTSTYYGEEGGKPPKREGRGVFLARFPDIPAIDVIKFARYRIYLAAPLFSEAERAYNAALARLLEENLFDVYVPQDAGDDSSGRDLTEHSRMFSAHREALDTADAVVAIIDGADADSGTAWEMGYASARGTPVFALRTDFRKVGVHEHVNLMLEQSATLVTSQKALLTALNSPLAEIPLSG